MLELLENNVSLTKGCFTHHPHEKKKKSASILPTVCYDVQFTFLWERMEGDLKNIEKYSYKETFEEIIHFINHSCQHSMKNINEIPAAVLVMGVNMPDHSHIFQLFEQQLNKNKIYATVILESKKCANFTSLLGQLVSEIINKYQQQLGDEVSSLRKVDHTFSHLYSYYKAIPDAKISSPTKKVGSPTKRARLSKNINYDLRSKPIVCLIQDVEAFDSEVLQEFIFNCNLYSDRLPIILVFGMASAMVTLHNLLPQRALSCLGIEMFFSLTATEYLTKIIEEVVISLKQPFKLGPRVFKLIIDTVLYHDFSISNITHLLKFCMIEHFYCNPVASLCCDSSEFENKIQKLDSSDLQFFKTLPSFQDYLENNSELVAIKNEDKLKIVILECLNKLCYYQKIMMVLLRCLHCLICDIPGYPLGKQFRELYSVALEKSIVLSTGFVTADKLLRMHSQNELIVKLKSCLDSLDSSDPNLKEPIITEAKEKICNYVKVLSLMDSEDHEKESIEPELLDNERIISRFQMQERMRLLIQKKRSKYEVYRTEILDYLVSLFKNIRPPSQIPLHEVFYFNNAASIRNHLMTVPRMTAHQALTNPHRYLKCSCCKIKEDGEINASMPDVCILYKLHLEAGKLINLYDWLESFKQIKEMESGKSKRKSNVKKNTSDLNTRFMQAVAELQLLGFIKKTKRKTDHVARLTFSNFT